MILTINNGHIKVNKVELGPVGTKKCSYCGRWIDVDKTTCPHCLGEVMPFSLPKDYPNTRAILFIPYRIVATKNITLKFPKETSFVYMYEDPEYMSINIIISHPDIPWVHPACKSPIINPQWVNGELVQWDTDRMWWGKL